MFSNKLSKDWKYKWFGFRGSEKKYVGRYYMLEDYVDKTCPPEILTKVIYYLSNAPIALAGQVPRDECGLCGELIDTAAYRTDGIWLWPDHLSHDVAKHDFCVPNQMVEHILASNGIPPKESGVPLVGCLGLNVGRNLRINSASLIQHPKPENRHSIP
jgi:hypothetical protein